MAVGNLAARSPSNPENVIEPDSDHALVARAQAGARDAFAQLIARHGDRLHAMLYHLANRNADLAAEFVQDAFARAFERLASFRGECAFGTWLYRLARNRALDVLARKRPQHLADDAAPVADQAAPGAALDQRERQALVQRALGKLAADERELLLLRDFDGRDYAELAALLDVPVGTVKSRLSRARASLRVLLEPHYACGDLP